MRKVYASLSFVSLGSCVPFTIQSRQALSEVPEYVLKYGASPSFSNGNLYMPWQVSLSGHSSQRVSNLFLEPLSRRYHLIVRTAPLIYLHSTEQYFPTDITTFLNHTTPRVAFDEVFGPSKPLSPSNVNHMGADVCLTSNDDITKSPRWIEGTKPDRNGRTDDAISAAVIVNNKGNGKVDAFYMYFYAYNYGGEVLGLSELNFGAYPPQIHLWFKHSS
ncbi:hypothetical protein NX059_005670 [Plenodomus lindquistii]|nr:hypothetical protein NX059_005670 [Plenodomus lindquistii]